MRQKAPCSFFYQQEFYPEGSNIAHLNLSPERIQLLDDLVTESTNLCHDYAHILGTDNDRRKGVPTPPGVHPLTDEERSWCHHRIEQTQQRIDDLQTIQRTGLTGLVLPTSSDTWEHVSDAIHAHRQEIDVFNTFPMGRDHDLVRRFLIAHSQWDQSGGWGNLRREGPGQIAGVDMARLVRVIDSFFARGRSVLNHDHSRAADEARRYAIRLIELGILPVDYPMHEGSVYRDMGINTEDETGTDQGSTGSGGNRFRSSNESLSLDLDMRDSRDLPSSFLDNPLEARRYLEALQYDALLASLKPRGPRPVSEVKPEDILKVDAILKVRDPLFKSWRNDRGNLEPPKPDQWWTRKLTPDY